MNKLTKISYKYLSKSTYLAVMKKETDAFHAHLKHIRIKLLMISALIIFCSLFNKNHHN